MPAHLSLPRRPTEQVHPMLQPMIGQESSKQLLFIIRVFDY